MSGCGQRTGFLTFTICSEPVAAACFKCGKPICVSHLQSGPSGPSCPDCAVTGLDADEASRRGLDSAYYRQSTNNDTGFTTYSASDYEGFDSAEGQGGEMGGGGASGEWSDESGMDGSDSTGADDFQDS